MIMSQAALSPKEGNTRKYDYKIVRNGRSCLKKYVKQILKPRPGYTGSCITFVLWIISISLDPFICYVPSIHDEENLIKINTALMISIFVLYWSLLIYQMYISFREKKKEWQVFSKVESISLLFSNVLLYSLVLIPKMEIRDPIFSTVMGIFLFVYLVKVIGIYRLFTEEIKRTSRNKLAKAALIKIVLNLLLYLYGGHLFGGLWYLFAVWKKKECWKKACSKHDGCHYANHRFNVGPGDNKFLNDICFPKTGDTKIYEFGIFKDAFESHIVETTTEFWKKLLYCFRWGIQNLSGFGQNLEVSTHAWENIFVILIVIYGMGSFTFFIGNMQNVAKSAQKKLKEKKMRKMEIRRKQEETEKWVPFRNLSEKLQNVIKEYQQYNWDGGVDVKNLLSNLPTDHENSVKRELCPELLKKVEIFMWSEPLMLRLCDCVKPVVYAERTAIVRQGDPIDKILFVLQGKLWTFSSSSTVTIAGSDATDNVSHPEKRKDLFKSGDFWGEELVNWVLNEPSSSKVPNSDRTVQALTKVEAFVLMAGDLKHLYDQKADVIKSFLKRVIISKRNEKTMSTQEQTPPPPPPGEGELNIGPQIVIQRQ